MKLFLTGCTGFIGRELIPLLISEGHKLTIISRQSEKKIKMTVNSSEIKVIQMNPADSSSWNNEELQSSLQSCEGVINLAGEPIAEKRWTDEHCKEITNSRLETTKNLIQNLRNLKKSPKVLINASAIGFYGSHSQTEFTEEDIPGDDYLANLCQEWETIAKNKPRATRLLIIRIGIVLAKDGGALGKMLPIFKAGLGGPIGDGKQWMSWIHRTDICNLINESIKNSSFSGVINGVAPNPVRMNEFASLLGKVLGRPSLLAVPGPILKLILGDGARVVLEGQNVQSKKFKKLRFKFIFPTINEALKSILN
ncbi:TIGR01777 family oxidoreductase [Prochlorococcus marinus]|uniref:TIGR01777 family protein n=1 Tax=Prochlorococcus marinus XMU1408 TaxID=2213228 RepID=A0A318R604_PROMR|nr:TIGR01777 family oxidoreductase [Prochlorococcus marinus]MBW3041182.1 TIGR01777 family protein [Prochlorococcus marinus str. XMU1408]PYE03779.1 TIGR01777 family protein [Prochlorococcus marinus XMU1408]